MCAAAAPAPAPAAPGATGETGAVREFRGIWPYVVPPAGHFNTFVSTNAISLGLYQNLQEPPLFLYMWADDELDAHGGRILGMGQ